MTPQETAGETVDVLVQVFDRGQTRKTVVPVTAECFSKRCWREIAALKAAVLLELPFAWVSEHAKYGLRPEDRARLIGKGEQHEHD